MCVCLISACLPCPRGHTFLSERPLQRFHLSVGDKACQPHTATSSEPLTHMTMSMCCAPRFKSVSVLLPSPRFTRFSLKTSTDIYVSSRRVGCHASSHVGVPVCLSVCHDCCCRSFIGTAPEARGRGLGSRLLAEITSRADREGRWCLLEATSEKSEVGWGEGAGVEGQGVGVFRV